MYVLHVLMKGSKWQGAQCAACTIEIVDQGGMLTSACHVTRRKKGCRKGVQLTPHGVQLAPRNGQDAL